MLQDITNRLPAMVVNALHQAACLGSTYALLSLLASCLATLVDLGSSPSAPAELIRQTKVTC